MDVGLTLESFIYNERRGAWEPLIEPIHNAAGTYKPYTLNIKVNSTCITYHNNYVHVQLYV